MDYEERILKSLNSRNLDDNLWGATFAGGVEEKVEQILTALIALLQRDECEPLGEQGDVNYELCIGRAAIWLARLITKFEPVSTEVHSTTLAILTKLTLRDSFQISAHAREGLDVLEKRCD